MKTMNKNSIMRLVKYKNVLMRLNFLGLEKVFSRNLADALGITSAQVRKDFSLFGLSGNKRGGYLIKTLLHDLSEILRTEELIKIIIVGIGNIGKALINYQGFEKNEMKVTAGFDADSSKHGIMNGIPVLPMEDIASFIRDNEIKIAVVSVPDTAAQKIADMLVVSGIKGILNFAPVSLKIPDGVFVSNINVRLELEAIGYFVNTLEKNY